MTKNSRGADLIEKYLDGTCTEDELAEFQRILAADPEVADAFAMEARFDALLESCICEHTTEKIGADALASDETLASGPDSLATTGKPYGASRPTPNTRRLLGDRVAWALTIAIAVALAFVVHLGVRNALLVSELMARVQHYEQLVDTILS